MGASRMAHYVSRGARSPANPPEEVFVRVPLILLACAFVLAGCRGGDATDTAVSDTTAMAGQPEGHDAADSIPSRAQEEARDAGSKPQEVMDFLGIRGGAHVADIFAGGGYYTYLLSQRVGASGRVYAQGYSPGLAARLERGDLAGAGNVVLVDSLSDLPEGGLDARQVREIRRIKARVDTERMPRGVDPRMHTKLGPGALADVEWTAQLMQLRHAHVEPALRTVSTLDALRALATVADEEKPQCR